jgi:hypothetical protein
MTAPGRRGPARDPGSATPEPNPFAEAEKLMAEWEARHDVAASGRRIGGLGVSQYLAHERCTEACSTAGHQHRRPRAQERDRRPSAPPDPHPHMSDLWGWLGGPGSRSTHS